ncbi:lytic murein transglycosylase [Rugosimonospora africana]|uniref:Murein transglycosylase n=1 Tax=Rugosimonospora africana TaxID=556532 RepID=A0A8J3VMG7_9ACTN|nr:lytic murein transglycosylase [Rugosimonospora africana]GIH12294.1 murein transglycosylase [Rugosimonospora africana]
MAATGRALHRWALRPSGRFVLPALALAALLALAGGAGGYLVPATAPDKPLSQADPHAAGADGTQPSAPDGLDPDATPLPGATDLPTDEPTGTTAAVTRPEDVLAGWATKLSPVLGIPIVALEAYGYAQLWSQQSLPSCHLTWTTLAGIGKVESNHGRTNGAVLQQDGRAMPPIIGLTLDGTGERAKIPDTDHGRYDGDMIYDHAIGPMQFLPNTWGKYQVDADQDGSADPNDINDAALAAADYLCAGGRNLSVPADWRSAILSYNDLDSYADDVFAAADNYGMQSRTVS